VKGSFFNRISPLTLSKDDEYKKGSLALIIINQKFVEWRELKSWCYANSSIMLLRPKSIDFEEYYSRFRQNVKRLMTGEAVNDMSFMLIYE
jgi:hypothetical protein